MQITDGNRAPNLLPVALVLSVVFWLFTMTGGRDIFVKEVLGGAYDSQAEHFLRGDVGVDAAASAHETMIVTAKYGCIWAVPRAASHSSEFHPSSRTREMVADFRILRGSHRTVCVCRSGENCVAFIPAFVTRA